MSKQFLKQISRIAILNFLFIALLSQLLPVSKGIPKRIRINQSQSASPTDLLSQLSQHNKTSDCWMVIDGKFYDITPYFCSHPDGDKSLFRHCGTDATEAYNTKDTGSKRNHSGYAKSLLLQYLIR